MHLTALKHLTHLNLSGCALTDHCLATFHSTYILSKSTWLCADELVGGCGLDFPSLRSVSLFGCRITATSRKISDTPRHVLLGINQV